MGAQTLTKKDEYMLAEFKGTYRAPHPEGVKDANITKPFHVKVKIKRSFLAAPGLNAVFATYYKERLRQMFPEMIDLYQFNLVQATEMDGTKIVNPKTLSYEDLLTYIAEHEYPINPALYPPNELRNEVILFEQDKSGQQHLQAKLQKQKGAMLEVMAELQTLDDVISVVSESEAVVPITKGKSKREEAFS